MAKAKSYNKIPYETRLMLIELVSEGGLSCVMAGKKLGITASTAKMIVKKYRENGVIFEKKEDKVKREHLEGYLEQQTVASSICASPPPVEITVPFFYMWPFPMPELLQPLSQFTY